MQGCVEPGIRPLPKASITSSSNARHAHHLAVESEQVVVVDALGASAREGFVDGNGGDRHAGRSREQCELPFERREEAPAGLAVGCAVVDGDVAHIRRPDRRSSPSTATGFSATRPVATIATCGPETTGAKKSTG